MDRTTRFPSVIEILGLCAGLAPFAVSMASVSSTWRDGALVRFEYHDELAIGGGALAVIFALIAAALLLRTAPGRKLVRGVTVLILLGLGGYQVAHGMGAIGVPTPHAPPASAFAPPASADVPVVAPPSIDLEAPTRAIFTAWNAGRFDQIRKDAAYEFRSASSLPKLQRYLETFSAAAGAYLDIDGVPAVSHSGDAWTVKGAARFARGRLPFTMSYRLVEGTARLVGVVLELPPALAHEPDAAEAAQTARRALDTLLAEQPDAFLRELDGDLAPPAGFASSLHGFVADLGAVGGAKLVTQEACGGGGKDQCLRYELSGAKRAGWAMFTLRTLVNHWVIVEYHVGFPPAAK